jgi:hypothetical protein
MKISYPTVVLAVLVLSSSNSIPVVSAFVAPKLLSRSFPADPSCRGFGNRMVSTDQVKTEVLEQTTTAGEVYSPLLTEVL